MPPGGPIALLVLVLSAPAGFAQRSAPRSSLAPFNDSLRTLTRGVAPAVVEILVEGYEMPDESNRSPARVRRAHGSGSGVIVDSSGYIMTNAHVIDHAMGIRAIVGAATDGTRAGALLAPQARSFAARVLGVDRKSDLALLRVDATDLPVLEFGNSDALSQGDFVLAVGSPMQLRNSLSVGVVSAVARTISDDDPVLYIQTDASINPGDSGGALIDTSGRLIGLNTSIMSKSGGNEGISFAVPGNLVSAVYRQLRSSGTAAHGSLGIVVQTLTPTLARGLSLHAPHGVVVVDVDPQGPGHSAGLERDDVVLSLDDSPIQTARQFDDTVDRGSAEKLRLLVQRRGETFSLAADVGAKAMPADPLALADPLDESLIAQLGIFCIEVDERVVEAMPGLRTHYGLVVAAMLAESRAETLDLKPGDIIHEINSLPVATLDAFRTSINQFQKGDAIALQIERAGRYRYTAFEIE